MSVLKRKRKQSKLEVYNHAVKMRKDLTMFLLRDLGTKRTVRNMRIRTDNMEPQDADLLLGITEKYNLTKFPGDYPEWLIEKLRDSIWDYLRGIVENITMAYSIWATNESEANERRICQDRTWRGDLKRKYQCYHTIKNMDELYKELIQWITNRWKNKRSGSQSLT